MVFQKPSRECPGGRPTHAEVRAEPVQRFRSPLRDERVVHAVHRRFERNELLEIEGKLAHGYRRNPGLEVHARRPSGTTRGRGCPSIERADVVSVTDSSPDGYIMREMFSPRRSRLWLPLSGHSAVRRCFSGELSRGVAHGPSFPVTFVSLVALLLAPKVSQSLTVNRINGSASVIYVDFSIPGKVIPLELVRTYNSITALNESTGWSGAFGWGWTSPFETMLTVTPERQVMLRDGQTGNTINFKPQKEDPKVRLQFFESVRAAYFERKLGRKPSKAEYARLQLPENVVSRLKGEPAFRAEMADKLGIQLPVPQGELLVSSEFGYQTLQFKANQWTRQKDGITQQFDKDGRLVRQTDRNGISLVYRYASGGKGELAEISDSQRFMSLKLTWRQGRVVEAVDNKGRRARYSYDGAGNLTQVIDSNGQTYGYRYENRKFPHALTHIDYLSEESGGVTPTRVLAYDDAGLVVSHRDKDGTETSYIYGRSASDPHNQFTTKTVRKTRTGVEEQFDEYQLKDRGDGSKYLYRQLSRQGGETTITILSACCAKRDDEVQLLRRRASQRKSEPDRTRFPRVRSALEKSHQSQSERLHVALRVRWSGQLGPRVEQPQRASGAQVRQVRTHSGIERLRRAKTRFSLRRIRPSDAHRRARGRKNPARIRCGRSDQKSDDARRQ